MPYDPMTGEFIQVGVDLVRHREAAAGIGTFMFYAARPDALAAYTNQMMTLLSIQEGTTGVTVASAGSLVGTGAAGALAAGAVPVVTMVGVWAALGSGYYEAREQAKSEQSKSGFAHGFVMGILDWKWHHVASRFGRRLIRTNKVDEAMDVIRVVSYNGGLKTGFRTGEALPAAGKKAYRIKLRSLAGRRGSGPWASDADAARNQQVSYVIELATAAVRNGIIRAQ